MIAAKSGVQLPADFLAAAMASGLSETALLRYIDTQVSPKIASEAYGHVSLFFDCMMHRVQWMMILIGGCKHKWARVWFQRRAFILLPRNAQYYRCGYKARLACCDGPYLGDMLTMRVGSLRRGQSSRGGWRGRCRSCATACSRTRASCSSSAPRSASTQVLADRLSGYMHYAVMSRVVASPCSPARQTHRTSRPSHCSYDASSAAHRRHIRVHSSNIVVRGPTETYQMVCNAACATVAEVRKRGAEFWDEFEFYLSDLVVGCVLDVVLVSLMAPAAVITAKGTSIGRAPRVPLGLCCAGPDTSSVSQTMLPSKCCRSCTRRARRERSSPRHSARYIAVTVATSSS